MPEIKILNNMNLSKEEVREWNDCLSDSDANKMFSNYLWLKIYCDVYNIRKIVVIIIREGNLTLGIFPFYENKIFLFSGLRFIGSDISDRCSLIIRRGYEKYCIESLNGFLKNNQRYKYLFVEKNSQLQDLLEYSDLKHKLISTSLIYQIELESFKDHSEKKLKKIINDNKRQISRLDREQGPICFCTHLGEKEKEDLLKLIVEFQLKRWKETLERAVLSNPLSVKFYKELLQSSLSENIVFSELRNSCDTIALHLGFIVDQVFYYLIPTYNDNYKKYSPSRVLMFHLIEEGIEKGLYKFDFGYGVEDYKVKYANCGQQIFTCLLAKNKIMLLPLYWRAVIINGLKTVKTVKKIYNLITK